MGGSWSSNPQQVVRHDQRGGIYSNPDKIRGLTRLLTEENKRKQDINRDEHDLHKDNMLILKQMFKKMDPTIMKTATYANHGDIQLSFKYQHNEQVLLIQVIRARDLQAKDLRGKTSDPYVTLYIDPADTYGGVMRTQTCPKTLEPVFHEIFTFPIRYEELRTAQLVLQVLDSDLMDKDDMMGEAIVNLGFDFTVKESHTAWFQLQEETDLRISGDLELTLTYEMPQTLKVTVHRANNLTNRYDEGAPNPFIKLQIPGIQFVFETEKMYGATSPAWEQTFDFPCQQHELKDKYLVLHAVDYDDGGANDSLGQVVIELENFDVEAGFHGSFDLADLKNSDRLRARWFQHATIMEFREALVAHGAFRQPKFLFQQHTGTKMIRVTSRKARSQAKLRIMNGIPVY